jgi:CheY-like chemotaxis protein
MTVPLEARGQTLGELGLFQTKDSGRSFSSWDRSIAKALAMRIALAVDKMRLLAAVREAHAAERRRLSAISHDLRNPLATMIAGVEFLRRTTGREQEHLDGRLEALGAIERSVRLQAKLIDALLDRTSDRAFDQAPDRASDLASDRASDRGSEGAMRPAPAPAEIGLLIVEDNRDTRKLLTYALRSLGYFAQAAGSAEEGLEFLRSEIEFGEAEPSTAPRRRIVILADIGLPGLDGYEFLRRARAMRKERTRAIAVTAWGSPSDVQRAWEAGFDAHFMKPVDIRVLDRTIRKLAGAPSEGASPASGSAAASCPAQAASPAEPPS